MADREGRPQRITVAATGAAIVATALALPMWLYPWVWEESHPRPCYSSPSEMYFQDTRCGPSGFTNALGLATFVVGVTSMILAIVARRREATRGSVAGQRLARWARRVAILGACSWGLFVLQVQEWGS